MPSDIAARAAWEVRWFLLAWAVAAAHAFLRPARAAWREQLLAAAAAYAAVPVLNAALTERGLAASIAAGDWLFVGFDAGMTAIAAGFAGAAIYIGRNAQTRAAPRAAATTTME